MDLACPAIQCWQLMCPWCTGPSLGAGLAGLSSQACRRISLQSCEGPPSPTGRWVAGFRAWQGSVVTWGFSHNSPWYWVIRNVDSHLWGPLTGECWPHVALLWSNLGPKSAWLPPGPVRQLQQLPVSIPATQSSNTVQLIRDKSRVCPVSP